MFSMESERTLLIRRKVSSQHDDEYATSRFVCVWRPISFLLLTAFGIFLIFHPTTTIKSEERAHGTAERIKVVDIEGSSSRTVKSKDGFPSFLDFANKASIHVGYDSRSILLNGERVLLLGGSLHPSRATRMTWEHALDEVVNNGLNLITLYVMWADHQPVPTKEIDWNFPKSIDCDETKGDSCEWNLSSAIRSAARRGLFVHIRIGPYDCAEYSYGGIPEWIPLKHPNMAMRRPNAEWLGVMQGFVKSIITYLDTEMLWAHQGGPIILGQIENELGGDIEDENEDLMVVNSDGKLLPRTDSSGKLRAEVRNATLQDYADWCGRLVQKLAPNVTWTMCNGLSAENTLLTCNAITEGVDFLEKYGFNGRVQIDQPAMFTEFEGGFQIWGETADDPSDYFWGRTAASMAYDALRWLARGGTHLNYYMFWGSYNRGRQAAAGITNMYASDVSLCPSGQRHHPKFGHLEALHTSIIENAPLLLNSKTALDSARPVQVLNETGEWVRGKDQLMFEYRNGLKKVLFVENNCNDTIVAKVPLDESGKTYMRFTMAPYSSVVIRDGIMEFDSASIDPQQTTFERVFSKGRDSLLLDWVEWQEPLGASPNDPKTVIHEYPEEQTKLNVESHVYSDYAWYETSFFFNHTDEQTKIIIDTQKANGMIVFINESFVGSVDDHQHKEGPTKLEIDVGDLAHGEHKLQILSESLGYNNLIGRWGGGTKQKTKGITGDVILSIGNNLNVSLVDGREWRSFPGLHGESEGIPSRNHLTDKKFESAVPSLPVWWSARFDTPQFEEYFQGLFLKINSGRGHLWLNGRDLGKYWNITKGASYNYSQEYYFLPSDYLYKNGRLNELVIFNALSESHVSVELVLSWTTNSDSANMRDGIDFPFACL